MSIMKSDEISLFFECRQKALATKQHPGFYRPDPVLRLLCRWRFHSHIPVVYLHRFTCTPGYTVLYQSYHLIRTEPVHTCPILLATDSWFGFFFGFASEFVLAFVQAVFVEDLEIQSMPLVRHRMSFDILFKLP